jgi:hypothetical protein
MKKMAAPADKTPVTQHGSKCVTIQALKPYKKLQIKFPST